MNSQKLEITIVHRNNSTYSARLNWPGKLAGISEGVRGSSKFIFLDQFSPPFLS